MKQHHNGKKQEAAIHFVGLLQQQQSSLEAALVREMNHVEWRISIYRRLEDVKEVWGSVIVFDFSDVVGEVHVEQIKKLIGHVPLCIVILVKSDQYKRQIRASFRGQRIPYVLVLQSAKVPEVWKPLRQFLLKWFPRS